MKNRFRSKGCLCGLYIFCLLLPLPATGAGSATEFVAIEIEKMAYQGSDTYEMRIALINKSSAPVRIRELSIHFQAQTEKGFAPLASTAAEGPSGAAWGLGADNRKIISSRVKIPSDLPGIFRTFEGDVSLVMRYRILTGKRHEAREEEAYYWIRPKTDSFILREGM